MGLLVVDGNNVMGSRPDGWWRDRAGAAQRLVESVAAHCGDEPVTVVFDGRRPDGFEEPGGVAVLFADRPGSDAADDAIAALVADDPRPERLEVVTSDARLAARVRASGARVRGAGAYRDEIERGAR
jgi:predicted RNA-binding protein with PIN domain